LKASSFVHQPVALKIQKIVLFAMHKLTATLSLFLVLIMTSACSTNPDSTGTSKEVKECEIIISSLTEKLVSTSKFDLIDGWQLMLDNPSCFPGADFDIAKAELEALKSQKLLESN
jgi:hypothetical protein